MKENLALLRYLRLQQQRDATKFKRDLFLFKIAQNRLLTCLFCAIKKSKKLIFFAALILFLERFLRLKILACTPNAIAAPQMDTEVNSLAKVFPLTIKIVCSDFGWLAPIKIVRLKKLFQLLWRLSGKFETYQTLRLAQFLGAYSKLHEFCKKRPAKLHIITSDANPQSLALLAHATRLHSRIAFISHGEVVPPVAKFPTDLALLLSKNAALTYQQAGNKWPQTLILGQKQLFRRFVPLESSQEIKLGIISGKFIDLQQIRIIATEMRQKLKIQQIYFRPHPAFRCNLQAIEELKKLGIQYKEKGSLEDFCLECNLLLIGNSTAIAECLLRGLPVLYFSDRAKIDDDRYGFVNLGLVLPHEAEINIEKINHFYSCPDFSKALAAYWNLEENTETTRMIFLEKLAELSPQ